MTMVDIDNEALREPNTYLASTPLAMVRQFMRIMGQPLNVQYFHDSRLALFRLLLIREEIEELSTATEAEEVLKELADVVYTAYGKAAAHGWDLDEAFRRVHASNMSKLDDHGNPIYRDDGKVCKGPNYSPPDLSDLVK